MTGLKTKIQETLRTMSTGTQENTRFSASESTGMGPLTKRGKSGPRRRKRWRTKHPLRELRLEKGYTLEELAELTDLSPSYLSRLESGSRRLNADIMQKLAEPLMCHPGDLLALECGLASAPYPTAPTEATMDMDHTRQQARHDLPLYHIASTPSGENIIDFAHPTEWMARPAELSEVSKAYAISMPSNAMAPRYLAGERLLAHPAKALTQKCFIIVTTKADQIVVGQFMGWKSEGSAEASIGPIEANDNDKLVLGQMHMHPTTDGNTNGEKDSLLFSRSDIASIARIVGSLEAA